MRLKPLIVVAFVFICGCGSAVGTFDETVPTQVEPYINRIDPATASSGDVVTIFGFGFSAVAELNVVIIDGVEVLADSYGLVAAPTSNEIETLTFTVPAGLSAGAHSIYVDVLDNVSNTNITLTIN